MPQPPTEIQQPEDETGHDRVLNIELDSIEPSPENDQIYRPVADDEPEIIALAQSIRKIGLREPIVISSDNFIISGHRRYAAARLAGLETVPCRVDSIRRCDDKNRFIGLLREYNRQRVKDLSEVLREELVSTDPSAAHRRLVQSRVERSKVTAPPIELDAISARSKISDAKTPMLRALMKVIDEHREFWPASDRVFHYKLLNDPPLRHAGKPHSKYRNDRQSYKDLCDLLTRARIDGLVPWEAIGDDTRPVLQWDVHTGTAPFLRRELDQFLRGYQRDLQRPQPNHIELIVEKLTLLPILRPVAEEFCIPMTVGRGKCSLAPRAGVATRFQESGKRQLVLVIVSDFDPDGEVIASSFAKSLIRDFGIRNVHPVKAALTHEQAIKFGLPRDVEAKAGSATYKQFVAKYGLHVHELEALDPAHLQQITRDSILSVLNADDFNRSLAQEEADAAHLEAVRKTVIEFMRAMDIGGQA